ncbi:MAG TPA: RNA polymerase sigma factor [Vicinamibacterales bacterium]|nr:RNA polymerase sigma factor [Vicinamibacterales bacterium]
MTLDQLVAAVPVAADADEAFQMTEDAFRLFYDRTARGLWAYLARISGDRRQADDLLQECYYRFLKSSAPIEDEAHRKNYLFRIATNLVLDAKRRPRVDETTPEHDDDPALRAPGDAAADAARRMDVDRAMAKLRPRDRAMLWLAYVNGSSHKEIADTLGLQTTSIKLLLFRARRRLAALLAE